MKTRVVALSAFGSMQSLLFAPLGIFRVQSLSTTRTVLLAGSDRHLCRSCAMSSRSRSQEIAVRLDDTSDDCIDPERRLLVIEDDFGYSRMRKGQIYVRPNFVTPSEIARLQKDIAQLQKEGSFRPSGLSNRVEGDENIFGSSDRLTCTIRPDLFRGDDRYSVMRNVVDERMESLRETLQATLSPRMPSVGDGDGPRATKPFGMHEKSESLHLELAEMYYSISPKGSRLPRHQDERHEDTKGQKGWITETRRSISWLIYLNDENWGDEKIEGEATTSIGGVGGELRAYCRKCCSDEHVQCGSHEGDLQVGWLRCDDDSTDNGTEFEPVFLDSWIKTRNEDYNQNIDSLEWKPMSALYRLRRRTKIEVHDEHSPSDDSTPLQQYTNPQKPLREYLSKPFGPNCPSWPSKMDLEPTDFARALASQLTRKDDQTRFVGTEDVPDAFLVAGTRSNSNFNVDNSSDMTIVDILPKGGTLVLFDSVTVPHEVLEVTKGTRLAIAGWFHEKQQDFPDWYGT